LFEKLNWLALFEKLWVKRFVRPAFHFLCKV